MIVVSSGGLGGAEKYALRIGQGAQGCGHDVTFVLQVEDATPTPFADALEEAGFTPLLVRTRSVRQGSLKLRSLLRRTRPDLVHSNLPRADLCVRLARVGLRIPQVLTFHNLDSRYGALKGRSLLYLVARSADGLIAPSDAVRQYIASLSRTAPGRITVIPHGVDEFPQAEPSDQRRVAVVGRLAAGKGHAELIQALAGAGEPWAARFVGDGPQLGALQSLAASLGVDVEFVGAVAEPRSYLEDISVLAVPTLASIQEGFGLSAIEAMSTGRPVVLSDLPALREIAHGLIGPDLVDPADRQRFMSAIEAAYENRVSWGQFAREHAQKSYSLDSMVARTISLMREVAAYPSENEQTLSS